MKKILMLLITTFNIFLLTGCGNNDKVINNKFINANVDDNGDIIINTSDITSDATYINYVVDDVIIQLIAVRGTDGLVHLAFNTCQSCNPSPNAYFIQEGEYFICQNCGNRFHINQIGTSIGGCNPSPVEEKNVQEDIIIISNEYVKTYKEKFRNWQGPTE